MMVSWNFKDFHGVRPYQCTRGQKRWLLWLCLTVVGIYVCYCYWHVQWHCVYCHHVSHQVGSQRIPCIHCTLLGVSIVIGVPQNRLFIIENLIKMDDLEVPRFRKPPIWSLRHIILGIVMFRCAKRRFFFVVSNMFLFHSMISFFQEVLKG